MGRYVVLGYSWTGRAEVGHRGAFVHLQQTMGNCFLRTIIKCSIVRMHAKTGPWSNIFIKLSVCFYSKPIIFKLFNLKLTINSNEINPLLAQISFSKISYHIVSLFWHHMDMGWYVVLGISRTGRAEVGHRGAFVHL